MYLRMQMEGRGARTIQLVHSTLHCALKQAVKERLLGYNPMDAVERPKVETQEFHIFTDEPYLSQGGIIILEISKIFLKAMATPDIMPG